MYFVGHRNKFGVVQSFGEKARLNTIIDRAESVTIADYCEVARHVLIPNVFPGGFSVIFFDNFVKKGLRATIGKLASGQGDLLFATRAPLRRTYCVSPHSRSGSSCMLRAAPPSAGVFDVAAKIDCARVLAVAAAQAAETSFDKAEVAQKCVVTFPADVDSVTVDAISPAQTDVEHNPDGNVPPATDFEPPLDPTPAQTQALLDARATAAADDDGISEAICFATTAFVGLDSRGRYIHVSVGTSPPCFLFGAESDGIPQKALYNTIKEVETFLCTEEVLPILPPQRLVWPGNPATRDQYG